MNQVLVETNYESYLEEIDAAEESDRLENVRELMSSAREYDGMHPDDSSLEAYLEQVSLVSDTDGLDDPVDDGGNVTLMTLHSAKGLEYPSVYIMALEEEYIPHRRSRENLDDLEEERRLLFVGVTRAEEDLQLSLAGYRMKRGSNLPTVPSMFIREFPVDELDVQKLPAVGYGSERFGYSEFEDSSDAYEGSMNRAADSSGQNEAEWEYSQDDVEESAETTQASLAGSSKAPPPGFKVMTAADLAKSAARSTSAVDEEPPDSKANYLSHPRELTEGMVVSHPEYGAGAVVSFTGKGRKAKVTVRFFGQSRPKSFYLAHAKLQAVRS